MINVVRTFTMDNPTAELAYETLKRSPQDLLEQLATENKQAIMTNAQQGQPTTFLKSLDSFMCTRMKAYLQTNGSSQYGRFVINEYTTKECDNDGTYRVTNCDLEYKVRDD